MFFGGSRKVWGNKWVGDNYSAPRVSFPGGLPALLPDLLDPLDPGPPAQGDNQETTTISPSTRPSVPLARPGPGKGEGDCCLLLYCPPIGTPLVGGRGWSLTPPKKNAPAHFHPPGRGPQLKGTSRVPVSWELLTGQGWISVDISGPSTFRTLVHSTGSPCRHAGAPRTF